MGGGSISSFNKATTTGLAFWTKAKNAPHRAAPDRAAVTWASFLGGQVDGTRASGGRERADATARASSSSSGAVGIKRV